MGKTIGVDLGDTHFRVSYLDGKTPKVLMDEAGVSAFPSKVSFLQGGGFHVGPNADLFGIPENTVLHPISIVGLSFTELQKLNSRYTYQFFKEGKSIHIDAHRVFPSIQDVLVAIFSYIKNTAEKQLGDEVTDVVIAIPDGSNDPKRIAIKKAAEQAGFKVRQLLNQTVAAALGYRFDRGSKQKKIAIIDFGASHVSASILQGGNDQLEVVTTSHLGIGTIALQNRLIDLVNAKYLSETGFNILREGGDFSRQEMAYEAKYFLEKLSFEKKIEFSAGGVGLGGKRIVVAVTRAEFEKYISNELKLLRDLFNSFSGQRGLQTVILIGGGGHVPVVKQMVSQAFGITPFVSTSIDPLEAVCLGSAVKIGILTGEIKSTSIEKTVHDLGTYVNGDMMDVLIPRGTPLPVHTPMKTYGMYQTNYIEKVYQYTGNDSGQGKKERDSGLVVLAKKSLKTAGNGVGNTFIIDANGVATFVVTDIGTGKEYPLTGFNID